MKSKAPLMLIEQLVMLAVFALAAALCLQAFVRSDNMSRDSENRDRAALLCQSVAEALQSTGGDFAAAAQRLGAGARSGSLQAGYAADWTPAAGTPRFVLGAAELDSDLPGLGRATVWVRDEELDRELYRLEVAWQKEVVPGA